MLTRVALMPSSGELASSLKLPMAVHEARCDETRHSWAAALQGALVKSTGEPEMLQCQVRRQERRLHPAEASTLRAQGMMQ